MMPYKAQVSNASRLGATRIAVPFERNRRVYKVLELFMPNKSQTNPMAVQPSTFHADFFDEFRSTDY